MYVCIYVYMGVCVNVCMYINYKYIYIYIYTYIHIYIWKRRRRFASFRNRQRRGIIGMHEPTAERHELSRPDERNNSIVQCNCGRYTRISPESWIDTPISRATCTIETYELSRPNKRNNSIVQFNGRGVIPQ